jgi:site-specific DNA-cytosine methylase
VTLRALELFSGLGGWRYALGELGSVVAAYDISPAANAAYELNHGERPHARELATLPAECLKAHGTDTWLLSPPCQPFCRMGNRQGLADPRCKAFLRLMAIFEEAPPKQLVLENVEGFLGSDAHALLIATLDRHGLHTQEYRLCPTQFGLPNQRPRVFVLASKRRLPHDPPPGLKPGPLAPFLDSEEDASLYLGAAVLARHKPGLDLVRSQDHRTACFIGGYGQRYVGSGSFLVTERGIRRFSTREVARLLGLPEAFRFPENTPQEKRYKLLGNGLSIPVARWVVQQLEG